MASAPRGRLQRPSDSNRNERAALATDLEGLTDEKFFAEVITFQPGATPPSRTRFDLLLAAKEHEMHHRGQLMLMERLVGITPHLTRDMQERMARFQAEAAKAK